MHTAIEGLLLIGEWVENVGVGVGKTKGAEGWSAENRRRLWQPVAAA